MLFLMYTYDLLSTHHPYMYVQLILMKRNLVLFLLCFLYGVSTTLSFVFVSIHLLKLPQNLDLQKPHRTIRMIYWRFSHGIVFDRM